MKSPSKFGITLVTVVALATSSSLVAQNSQAVHPRVQPLTLKFKTIDISSAQGTQIYAINNKNQGAGVYFDSTGLQHGMIIQAGQVTRIDDPQATPGTTFCNGINDSGVVVGYYSNAAGEELGFEYQDGTFTNVAMFNSPYVEVIGINNSGVLTGTYYNPGAGVWYAFYGSGSDFVSFTVPGGAYYVDAYGINDAGLITVGYFVDENNPVSMSDLYNPTTTTFTPINVPGASQSYVHGINNHNQIVYAWTDASGNSHGAVLAGGTFFSFDDPDGTQLRADGINDSAIVAGTFLPTGDTQRQSFVAGQQH